MGSDGSAPAIDPQAIPRVKQGMDWQGLDLSPEEGFVLSRIDGAANADAIAKQSGMPADKAIGLLGSLLGKEVIEFDGVAPAAEEGPLDYDPDDLEDGIDLSQDEQKEILRLFTKRDELSYYQLLGVDRQADTKAIKRAYFKVSKDFHPDTFFRKKIGTFKSKVVALFKLVSQAYEVLSNEQKRAAYDASLPYEPSQEEIEKEHLEEKLKERDARLREERRKRLLKRTPLAQRKTQARRHFEDAVEHEKNKKVNKAANCIRMALALDGDNPEYQAFLDKVAPKASAIRAEHELKRGRYEESMGNDEGALEAYLMAIELNPDESRALHRAASLMLQLKRDIKTALTFARKAEQLEPDTHEFVLTAANLYYEMGMHKNALREYNRYLQLNPFDERITERVKELRKMA